jgi:hypothetical protein
MQNGKHPKITLIEHFSAIPDPRVERTREHRLVDLLVIAVCTLLCGGESFYDMEDFGRAKRDWFESFLDLPNGIRSHGHLQPRVRGAGSGCFRELLCAVDPSAAADDQPGNRSDGWQSAPARLPQERADQICGQRLG